MLALAFFSWWYSEGWKDTCKRVVQAIANIGKNFSVSLLIRTLFQPWRRIISYPGAGIAAHFQALIDNSISRVIGFIVRSIVLLAALTASLIAAVLGLALIIIWPLIPPAVVASVIIGFTK